METFREAINMFKAYKKSKGLEESLTNKELIKLRNAFKKGLIKFEEKTKPSNDVEYFKLLQEYRIYKAKEEGTSLKETIITKEERNKLRESVSKEEKPVKDDDYIKVLKEFKAYKAKKTGKALNETIVTREERIKLKEGLKNTNESSDKDKLDIKMYRKALKEYTDFKCKELNDDTAIATLEERQKIREAIINKKYKSTDEKEFDTSSVFKKIQEARVNLRKAKIALREGDIPAAQGAVQDSGAALNGAMGEVDAATSQVPETVLSKIQAIKTSIDDLATEVGIQSPVDLGADPNAGVPADINAQAPAAGQPMIESKVIDLKKIKARIAEREKRVKELAGLNENEAGKKALETAVQFAPVDNTRKTSPNNPPSQDAGKATEQQAAAGTSKGVVRWPNKSVSETKPGKKLGNIEESSEKTDKAKIQESLDEKQVSDYINRERLKFSDIFRIGVLGICF
jgi:hypothetical protein